MKDATASLITQSLCAIPRNESAVSNDLFGTSTIQYSGKAPFDVRVIQNNCGTFNGSSNYVQLSSDPAASKSGNHARRPIQDQHG